MHAKTSFECHSHVKTSIACHSLSNLVLVLKYWETTVGANFLEARAIYNLRAICFEKKNLCFFKVNTKLPGSVCEKSS